MRPCPTTHGTDSQGGPCQVESLSTSVTKPPSHATTSGTKTMTLEVEATYEGGVLKPAGAASPS